MLRGMPPEARGYHGQPTDAAGFAAMHCDEVLVHGYDIALGLGVAFEPPPDLARRVRDRLFPWTPAGDPWTTLLWCNGRWRFRPWSGDGLVVAPTPRHVGRHAPPPGPLTGACWCPAGKNPADLRPLEVAPCTVR